MLHTHAYRKGHTSQTFFQAFRSWLILCSLFTCLSNQAQGLIKVSQGKDIYVRLLSDTSVVYGPVVQVRKSGEGFYAVEVFLGKWNLLDSKLVPVFIKPVENVSNVDKGVFLAQLKGKWGIADTKGKWVLKPQFDDTFGFSEGFAFVSIKDSWGIINTSGDWVQRPSLSLAKGSKHIIYENGYAIVPLSNGFALFDKKGLHVKNAVFKRLLLAAERSFWAIRDAGFVHHNSELKPLSDLQFEWVEEEKDAHPLRVKNKLKYGFYDVGKATLIQPCVYEMASPFRDGYAVVKDQKGFSFIDSLGEEFSSHWPFLKNLGKGFFAFSNQVSGERSYGLMDHFGKIVVPSGLSEINAFRGNWAGVLKNGKFYMIDKFGAPLTDNGYDRLFDYDENYAVVGDGNHALVIDTSGKIILGSTRAKLELP
ncbi:MAG: WG repeat-containing protein [Flavobacteriales bacterium]